MYDPGVFTHSPLEKQKFPSKHSLMSENRNIYWPINRINCNMMSYYLDKYGYFRQIRFGSSHLGTASPGRSFCSQADSCTWTTPLCSRKPDLFHRHQRSRTRPHLQPKHQLNVLSCSYKFLQSNNEWQHNRNKWSPYNKLYLFNMTLNTTDWERLRWKNIDVYRYTILYFQQ